jgi:3-oxoacyl-[acyl-carrier protein] reductase
MSSFADKTVLVTGASRGIGRAIARGFLAAGANVVGVARGVGGLEALAAEAPDGRFLAHAADVGSEADVTALIAATVERFGGIDVLCHNAGIYPEARIEEMVLSEWEEVMTTNLTSTFLLVRRCLASMRERGRGRIVLISSITGSRVGYPGLSHYGATKAGMSGFMRGAALEFATAGITINAVEPGSIRTEGLDGLGAEAIAAMAKYIPVGHVGEPEDIANAVLFLARDEAGFITGQTLVVDGGQTLPELPL